MSTPAENLDYKNQPDNKELSHIPGDYGVIPYLGKTLNFVNDLMGYVDQCYKKYGEVSKIKIGGQVGVMVVGPDIYQQIYLDKDKVFSTEMGYKNSIGTFYPGGLLMRDGADHKFQRRMFQTAFKNEPMKGYVDIMNPYYAKHMHQWPGKQDFHFFPHIKETLLEVGAAVFIGIEDGDKSTLDRVNRAFLDISEEGLMALFRVDLPGFKFHKGMQGKKFFEEFFGKLIPERRNGNGIDMMSYLCKEKDDNGNYFPDSDLIPHLSFLLFAAHDTTTSALTNMVMQTAVNTEWQDRLREESRALGKPTLDYEDLDKMEGLEMVMNEALRLDPSVSLMTRRTIRDTEIGGYRIPANTMVFIPPGYNHRMPEYWTNPASFDPDRFSPEREEHKNHSFCFVPFGGGAHKCIGMHFAKMQAKCFMHQFLLNYKYSVDPGYQIDTAAFPLPKPKDNLPLKIEKI